MVTCVTDTLPVIGEIAVSLKRRDPTLAAPWTTLERVMSAPTLDRPASATDEPEVGQLVRARGQQWVVSAINRSEQPVDELAAAALPGRTLVTLTSVSDDDLGDELTVIWEVEPGREVLPATKLPAVTANAWDDPERLGAFLDAVRWGTVASADTRTLQAPFRSGIRIETYQLEPVARALAMPRVNLLIADDVGLGKTIEAGLVAQEMLLRHRARRLLIVCPASLTIKWREEMAEKFGLDFVVLNADTLRALRRTHGLEANPFTVFPRVIISLQWLRTPRVQRLLDEVLTPETRHPGFVDLLVVDEAHHCAPPAPQRDKGYAVDSLQTKAVRRLGEHAQHRLFLSATPHNGYRESWEALLEMLDPQRFARGVDPDPKVVGQVMVRRLKEEITGPDGEPVFAPRNPPRAIEVDYGDAEREAHELLARYAEARRRTTVGRNGVRAGDLVTLLLKKRLFSSPAAFAHTLAAHADAVRRSDPSRQAVQSAGNGDLPGWMDEGWDDDLGDDEAGGEAEQALLDGIAELSSPADEGERDLLAALQRWADRRAGPADAKATALIEELNVVCRPDGSWSDERVIVFTEYVDTLTWLAELLTARDLGGERLGLLHGGMDEAKREHLKAAFQASPDRDPVRILLATDAAGEGIDLQRHCHRVINYDVPFNPNRLEQRIGRVDRFGQSDPVDVAHFVGAGWQHAPAGSFEADLEFLSRVARKVATERADLGSVNPVLAHAVEDRMLGRSTLADPMAVRPKPAAEQLAAERNLREQARRLREQLTDSVDRLHVAPDNVRRVVDTAFALAGQPPLVDDLGGRIAPPDLRAGWERTLTGLADPLSGTLRPLTFDPAVADGRDDVVLAHLEHPLVAHATRLLRSAVWGGTTALNRVSAVRVTFPAEARIADPLVCVFARLVVVGADGRRLHEEVMLAARAVPAQGRSRRLELEQPRFAPIRNAVETALAPGRTRPAGRTVRERLATAWPDLAPLLAGDVQARAAERLAQMDRTLTQRAADERRRTEAVFDQLAATLQAALDGPGPTQLSFDDLDAEERSQVDRDRRAWRSRLDDLDDDRARELAAIEARYAGVRELVFPFAVMLAVPEENAAPEGTTP
jgi:superfamily II DNA or RNA helicase